MTTLHPTAMRNPSAHCWILLVEFRADRALGHVPAGTSAFMVELAHRLSIMVRSAWLGSH